MTSIDAFRFGRVCQRRISMLLAAVMCLWLVTVATHHHSRDQDLNKHRSATHLCSTCGSLSSGAVAATVASFSPTVLPDPAPVLWALQPAASFRLIIAHRSRAPPFA